jgi:hypothetical protein
MIDAGPSIPQPRNRMTTAILRGARTAPWHGRVGDLIVGGIWRPALRGHLVRGAPNVLSCFELPLQIRIGRPSARSPQIHLPTAIHGRTATPTFANGRFLP